MVGVAFLGAIKDWSGVLGLFPYYTLARAIKKRYPQVEVLTGAFEDWLPKMGAFDLAIAATAFHWLDPTLAYPKTACAGIYLRGNAASSCCPNSCRSR